MPENCRPSVNTRIWVDTDFGFDDLWALLLLKHFDLKVDGVSLVSGNTLLPQVTRNAEASVRAFEFDWPFYAGAKKPLQREPETAEHILGNLGMRSRGTSLPYLDSSTACQIQPESAIDAMARWLNQGLNKDANNHILALGPLTNLGQLLSQHPDATSRIQQITWLGGSRGRGNQTQFAEFNALADPEALSIVASSNIPFRMIDLELCRQVSVAEGDMPTTQGTNQHLVADLLGGYVDIALQRGRQAMSIYDPLAALTLAEPALFNFTPASLEVELEPNAEYGRTVVEMTADSGSTTFETAVSVESEKARDICLSVLIDA